MTGGFGEEFPFNKPDGSDLDMFIQWKGTDLCADFCCPCGYNGHIDGDFTYVVRCGGCGAHYEMGTQVIARRIEPPVPEGSPASYHIDHPKTFTVDPGGTVE